ncbi:MAG: hypothetical protein U9N42_07730 [Campylobacterota bacterium]|nr:hypothetical protein [Campylobacterota bacterium]
MSNITFNNVELNLQEHPQHEFLLSNKEVALGYGTSIQSLAQAKRNNTDELIENKHFIRLHVETNGGKQKVIHWTKKGIVRLGFFIKSQQAKEFRDWAEDYIVNDKQPLHVEDNTQLERENIELKRAMNRLLQNDDNKKLEAENNHLKNTLINVHNRYHNLLTTCSVKELEKELKRMTNNFQLISSTCNDGNNLNTETIARHGYWN